MKLKPNEKVKIFFRNGTTTEGIICAWEKDNYTLKSLDGKNLLIVQDPAQDIMLVKIVIDEPPKQIISMNDIKIDDPDKHKKLADLRAELIEEEKKAITEKLRTHTITGPPSESKYLPQSFLNIVKNKGQ